MVSAFPVISHQLNLTTNPRYDIINKSDRTIEDVIQLVNSQIRIVESGKVRSGQDPMKRAEDALKGLSSDQRSGLMERLMTEAGA